MTDGQSEACLWNGPFPANKERFEKRSDRPTWFELCRKKNEEFNRELKRRENEQKNDAGN